MLALSLPVPKSVIYLAPPANLGAGEAVDFPSAPVQLLLHWRASVH